MRVAHKLRNFTIFIVFLSFLYSIKAASAENELKEDYDQLFLFVTIISAVVAIGVIGIWIRFMYQFSESNTEAERQPISHEASRKLELTWTVVTIGIVILLMIVSYPFLFELDNATDLEPEKTVLVSASEYQWQFTYQNSTDDWVTERFLVIEAGFNYQFNVTSISQYIHSFYVPDLGLKMDAIPGVVNTITIYIGNTGTYDVLCAEYCGFGHSLMRPDAKGVLEGEFVITVIS